MPNIPETNVPTNVGVLTADTNRTALIIRPELVYNEPMDTGLRHYGTSRFTGETFKATKKTEKSAEITPNRASAGLVMLALNGGGGFSGEFSANTWDGLMEAAMCGTWAQQGGIWRVTNGVVHRSFAVEKQFLDILQFFRFAGNEVDGMVITINAEKIVTIEFSFMGSKFVGVFQAPIDAAPLGRTTTPIISAGVSAGAIKIDGANYGGKLSMVKIDLKNNYREKPAIGSFYSDPHGQGDFDVTVTLTGYFGGIQLYTKFINNQPVALEVPLTGYSGDPAAANNTYTFKFPNLQIPDQNIVIPGRNADVQDTVTLAGFFDANGVVMAIEKTIALVP